MRDMSHSGVSVGGKKRVHVNRNSHNKDNFCSSFFILTTNLAKNGYFSENKKSLYLVKLNHSHRKYSRKRFYRKIFLKCSLSHSIVSMDAVLCVALYRSLPKGAAPHPHVLMDERSNLSMSGSCLVSTM